MSQADLAREAGEAREWISKPENGHVNPSWARVKRLADALDSKMEDVGRIEWDYETGRRTDAA